MNTSIDGATGIPDKVIFSNAACDDRTKMDELMTDKETIYICDKGYVDYKRFDKKVSLGSQYITQTKKSYRIVKINDPTGKELTFVTNVMQFHQKKSLSSINEDGI